MNTRPRSIQATFVLILINIFIWLAFGIIVAANLHPALPDQPLIKTIMASMAFAIAAILSILLALLVRHNHAAYFFTLGLLVLLSCATIFDDFGLSDLAVLLINIAPIVLLVKDRAWYLQARSISADSQKTA